MHAHIPVITILTCLLMLAAMVVVGMCRGKYKVLAPATSGHPTFERAFRAQANTVEQVLIFLPLLWVAHSYGYSTWAAYFGYAWLIGRTWYLIGYIQEAGKRSMGFLISSLAAGGLLVLCLMGAFKSFF
ncbi:MAPEG family protein [Ahniella affigens]|uniref:MAPEG family protein n=1 Tax=Ahniella affigens TaxID=2021234 RepID=A0A2P1PUH6_9GAMM|nr:MAPEG family protein [Ahniella affigens]AVP98506.1 MAPEG family protein [Ahniella affigens]